MSATAERLKVVVYEGGGAERLDADERFSLVRDLLEAGYDVARARCLCEIADLGSPLLVVGRFEAATRDSLRAGGDGVGFAVRDLGELDLRSAVEAVEAIRTEMSAEGCGTWIPWFPVIDHSLCTNCRKCLGFCLFGVYDVDAEGQVRVAHPARCKTNCPACARVCPSGAVVFAKYASGPISGDTAADDEPVQVDLDVLSRTDVYAALRHRRAASKSGALDADRAEAERCECLDRLQEQLRIPAELLDALSRPNRDAEEDGDAPT